MRSSKAYSVLRVQESDSICTIVNQYRKLELYGYANRKINRAYLCIMKNQYDDLIYRRKIEVLALKSVHDKKRCKNNEVIDLILNCTLATLLRQAVEFIVNFKAETLGVHLCLDLENIKEKDLSEKIDFLYQNNYITSTEIKYYDIIRKNSNLAVHFENTSDSEDLIKQLRKNYEPILNLIDNFTRQHNHAVIEYLILIRNSLNKFIFDGSNIREIYNYIYDIDNTFVYTLLMSTLIRRNLECIVDKELLKNPYSYPIADDDTSLSLYEKITFIEKRISEKDAKILHETRKLANNIIHVYNFKSQDVSKGMMKLYEKLTEYYKPTLVLAKKGLKKRKYIKSKEYVYNNKNKNYNRRREPYSPSITAVLCIVFGSLGIHRFYVGDTKWGLAYLFTNGFFFIGVIIDLFLIITGNFKDGNKRYIGKPDFFCSFIMLAIILIIGGFVAAMVVTST